MHLLRPAFSALLALPFVQGLAARNSANQTTECLEGLSSLNNKNGESPCAIAQKLVDPCQEVLNMEDGANSACTCNTVLYSLVSACLLCRDDTKNIIPFNTWSSNCTPPKLVTTSNDYPLHNVSRAVDIPKYAYADLSSDGNFDLAAALHSLHGWNIVQILIPILVALILLLSFAAFLLYRRQRQQGYFSCPCKRPRRVRHRRRAQGWDLNSGAQTMGSIHYDPDAEVSPMIPNRRSRFSTSTSMDDGRSTGVVQNTVSHFLPTLVRAMRAVFAKRPVHVTSRTPTAAFDLDNTADTDAAFDPPIRSHRSKKSAEANVGPPAGGGHSQQSSLASSSGLTLDVSTMMAAYGAPGWVRSTENLRHAQKLQDDPFSDAVASQREARVAEEEETEPGVATGDSVLVISRDFVTALSSPTTTTDRRSLEVVPPTPRDDVHQSSTTGYYDRSPRPPLPPLPIAPLPDPSYPDEKAPRFRNKRPSPIPVMPAPATVVSGALSILSPPTAVPASHSVRRGRSRQNSASEKYPQPSEKPSPQTTTHTTTARAPRHSPNSSTTSKTTPQHSPHHTPNNSTSRPRAAYSADHSPNASPPFHNPYSPPFNVPTSPPLSRTPGDSPEFRSRASYFPPNTPPNAPIRASDPQNLIPASVRGAGYNPYARPPPDPSRYPDTPESD